MPRFEPNITAAQASFVTLPKDTYEFLINEPKIRLVKPKAGGSEDRLTLSYPLIVVEGNLRGKKTGTTLWLHTEESYGFAKQFIMIANGYKVSEESEAEFNEAFADASWLIDTDQNIIGDAWLTAKGKRILADVTVDPDPNDPTKQYNKYQWMVLE